jgi:hypothetical protein
MSATLILTHLRGVQDGPQHQHSIRIAPATQLMISGENMPLILAGGREKSPLLAIQ